MASDKRKAKNGSRELRQVIDPRLIRALAHPLRADVLTTLSERVASPSELAEEVGVGVSDVSYHVRELRKSQCIELVKTRRRRGAIEHFYRATARFMFDDREWERLPESVRPAISANIIQLIFDDLVGALEGNTFEARNRHLSRTPMFVDEQGWADLQALMERTLHQVLEIQAESGERLQEDVAAERFAATVAMMGFETSPEGT